MPPWQRSSSSQQSGGLGGANLLAGPENRKEKRAPLISTAAAALPKEVNATPLKEGHPWSSLHKADVAVPPKVQRGISPDGV